MLFRRSTSHRPRRLRVVALAATAAALAVPAAANADDAFLVVPGAQFRGEVPSGPMKGAIGLATAKWNVKRATPAAPPSFGELTITKQIDRTSPAFMAAAVMGTPIASARVVLRALVDQAAGVNTYDEVCLGNVQVMSYDVASSPGVDRGSETVTLKYGQILQRYTPYSAGVAQLPLTWGWDLGLARVFDSQVNCV